MQELGQNTVSLVVVMYLLMSNDVILTKPSAQGGLAKPFSRLQAVINLCKVSPVCESRRTVKASVARSLLPFRRDNLMAPLNLGTNAVGEQLRSRAAELVALLICSAMISAAFGHHVHMHV